MMASGVSPSVGGGGMEVDNEGYCPGGHDRRPAGSTTDGDRRRSTGGRDRPLEPPEAGGRSAAGPGRGRISIQEHRGCRGQGRVVDKDVLSGRVHVRGSSAAGVRGEAHRYRPRCRRNGPRRRPPGSRRWSPGGAVALLGGQLVAPVDGCLHVPEHLEGVGPGRSQRGVLIGEVILEHLLLADRRGCAHAQLGPGDPGHLLQ